MTHVGVIDTPGARSSHTRPTPKGGGVGIVAAFLLGFGILYAAGFAPAAAPSLILAAVGVAAVSYLDDMFAWPASVKLAAQLAAAAVAVGAGLTVESLSLPWLGRVHLGWFGPAGTVVWFLLVTNAMNFIDGLNGLAAGVSLIACLVLAGLAAQAGAGFVYAAAVILASGLLGFLPFNFPNARIFMGDVGSQFCGWLLAALAIALEPSEATDLSIALVPMLLFAVLFDVVFTVFRRAAAGERLMQAHRGHLYQIAHRSGLSAIRVALLHWGFAAWGGICCIGLLAAAPWWKPVWLLLVIPPQLGWLAWVRRGAVRAGITHW